ncbi:DUF3265 domain-containing protein [Vibrio alginolyticus]|nr:DUF3265 domain-containing protein [Vibrio alginolyticus]
MTNCLRVIRNAWHFYSAMCSVIKALSRFLSIAFLTP